MNSHSLSTQHRLGLVVPAWHGANEVWAASMVNFGMVKYGLGFALDIRMQEVRG